MIVTEIYPGSALGNQLWWMVVTRILAEKNGYEGMMIRKDTTYQGKRSRDIMKCKKFHDAEYQIVGCTNGDIRVVVDG